jgi:hypothetical protein
VRCDEPLDLPSDERQRADHDVESLVAALELRHGDNCGPAGLLAARAGRDIDAGRDDAQPFGPSTRFESQPFGVTADRNRTVGAAKRESGESRSRADLERVHVLDDRHTKDALGKRGSGARNDVPAQDNVRPETKHERERAKVEPRDRGFSPPAVPDPLDCERLCAVELIGPGLIEGDYTELVRPDVLCETMGDVLDAATRGREVGRQDGDAQG